MKKYCLLFTLNLFLLSFASKINAQLFFDKTVNANQLVEKLMGNACITYSNALYTGDTLNAKATFIGTTAMGINEGIILSSGDVESAVTTVYPQTSDVKNNTPGDADLDVYAAPQQTFDAAILEFDFVPLADSIFFRYLFGSEEYHDGFDAYTAFDLFAFFISGPGIAGKQNIANIPGTATPVGRGTINRTTNTQYFHDNNTRTQTGYRGWTSVFRSGIKVEIGKTYHAKIVIADVMNRNIDSGVLIETIECSTPAPLPPVFTATTHSSNNTSTTQNTFDEGCENIILKVKASKPVSSPTSIAINISGNATNGTDYTVSSTSVTIPTGSDSAVFTITLLNDNIVEGNEIINIDFNPSTLGIAPIIGITIRDVPPIAIDINPEYTICYGNNITLSPNVSGGKPNYEYLWDNGKTSLSITEPPNVQTTYRITVTDVCNNTNTASTVVNLETGSAEAGEDQSICFGQQATLTAEVANSYQWSTGATTQSINVSPQQTTKYYLSATSNCLAVDSVTVNVYPVMPISIITQKTTICQGQQATLTANATANSYYWSAIPSDQTIGAQSNSNAINVQPSVSTMYSLIITDKNGCSNTTSLKINVDPGPIASFKFTSNTGCVATPIEITSNVSNQGFTYMWNFGNGKLFSGNNGVSNEIVWDTLGFKHVSLQIVSENGCYGNVYNDSIEIFDIPTVDFTAVDTSGCPPLVVLFNTDSIDTKYPNAEYYWEFGDKTTSSSKTEVHLYKNTGKYNVTLKVTNAGCSNSKTKNNYIYAYPLPKAEFRTTPEEVSIFFPDVIFYDITKNAEKTAWYLLWNDSVFENVPKFEYEFTDTGYHHFYLIATNSFECKDSALGNVYIKEDFTLYRPNCFTPNGDGLNDEFEVKGVGIIEYRITLYNRWGQVVYSSEDINEKWNGTHNNTGQLVPTGVYSYRIEYKNTLLKRNTIFGYVIVLYKK